MVFGSDPPLSRFDFLHNSIVELAAAPNVFLVSSLGNSPPHIDPWIDFFFRKSLEFNKNKNYRESWS